MVVLSELLAEPSSSSSTTHAHHNYDVFLSFRGIDTRLNFTDHLHQALVNANITTFLDDEEIETGLSLKPELESAIKASRASIIVLSENYASSTWCLDELVLILDQKRTSGHIVIPIFYHVEPTDVRKQKSSFGIAMAKHTQRMEAEKNVEEKIQWAEKVNKWKKALVEVANLKGKDAKDRQETKFIEEIVTDIYHRLGAPLRSSLPLLCGMENSIEFIISWLKDGSSHPADILTIFGLGGIGKTSLVRYVHELHCRLFDRSSFIEGVNEKCTQQVNGLLDLQKQLSHDISKTSPIHIHDVFRYTSVIENTLARQKVFIVLDDIDSLEQLDALLGKKGFHPGSKIIITTKDSSLNEKYSLSDSTVQPKHTKLFLKGLDAQASLQLLSYHAFKGNSPKKGYEKMSEKLLAYCQGHPLALKVLGESLHKRDAAEWEERIEGLKEETDPRIQRVLQMSFDSIPSNNDKELFKHIACFFVGKDRNYTETILKACNIRTLHGIRNLIDRCLLTIGPWNELKMHQLLQEMGRDVVRQESPNKPWKRSRLWSHEESFNVLEQNKGSGKLIGLVLDMEMLQIEEIYEPFELKVDALSKMDNLMLLQLNYVKFDSSYKNFPKKLRWLCMHGFPLKSLPSDLPMENMVALDMSYSNLESFDMSYGNQQRLGKRQKLSGSCSKGKGFLRSLKILNLSFCKQLRTLGGFIEFPALERLILAKCTSLMEIGESIEQCDELDFIDLSYCNEAGKLLMTIGKLKKVKILKLDGCNLGEFPTETRDHAELLEMLNGNNVGIKSETFSSVILETIPRALRFSMIFLPRSLVCLSLQHNRLSNESFPMDFSNLSMLKELYLDNNPIVSLPNCVRSLPRLEILSMDSCVKLKTLEHPPRTLKDLSFGFLDNLDRVLFDQEMSPITLNMNSHSESFIEGMFEVKDMENVEEEVLRSLGWTDLEFTKIQLLKSGSKKMQYELGIFSTTYNGKEIPNWISHRSNGPSISFTIPSSPNYKLRGLNLFCVFKNVMDFDDIWLYISIRNTTKMCTWTYNRCIGIVSADVEGVIDLSHWMFGKNDMEDGDQITITVYKPGYNDVGDDDDDAVVADDDDDNDGGGGGGSGGNDDDDDYVADDDDDDYASDDDDDDYAADHDDDYFALDNDDYFADDDDDDYVADDDDVVAYDDDDDDDDVVVGIREWGVSFVYDEDEEEEEEEDVLGYYKSWNHIIGGDLSPFLTTTGDYILDKGQFFGNQFNILYVDGRPLFRAFRPSKSK